MYNISGLDGYEEILMSCLLGYEEKLTSANKVGGSKKIKNMVT